MTNLELIAGALVICLSPIAILLTVIYLYKVKKLLSYLECNHQVEWGKIGEMTLLINNSIKNTFLFIHWLINEKYMYLNDKLVCSMGEGCRALFFWAVGVILIDQLMIILIVVVAN